jgi:hypothetical protein
MAPELFLTNPDPKKLIDSQTHNKIVYVFDFLDFIFFSSFTLD